MIRIEIVKKDKINMVDLSITNNDSSSNFSIFIADLPMDLVGEQIQKYVDKYEEEK